MALRDRSLRRRRIVPSSCAVRGRNPPRARRCGARCRTRYSAVCSTKGTKTGCSGKSLVRLSRPEVNSRTVPSPIFFSSSKRRPVRQAGDHARVAGIHAHRKIKFHAGPAVGLFHRRVRGIGVAPRSESDRSCGNNRGTPERCRQRRERACCAPPRFLPRSTRCRRPAHIARARFQTAREPRSSRKGRRTRTSRAADSAASPALTVSSVKADSAAEPSAERK